MKVILVNGSPHKDGCTAAALGEVADALGQSGIETEVFWLGIKPQSGCIACGGCKSSGLCAVNETAREFNKKAGSADGFVFGSPVHYAAITGALSSFMSCAFYSNSCAGGNTYYMKPAAAVLSARRAGTTAAFDQINKFFTISQMPIVSSQYWNMVHGTRAEDVKSDAEGMQIMRVLGRNMAYLLKCIRSGTASGILLPEPEPKVRTNFIR